MKAFLATVLSVIAGGVVLIAYGVLAGGARADAPNAAAPVVYDASAGTYQLARPMYANQQIAPLSGYHTRTLVAPAALASRTAAAPHRTVGIEGVRSRPRDWKQTALVIGGSAASGAGLGAIVGGKKGALIGAAIGGGASTLWEALTR
jgi:hypothetical protein